jgi:hypothetical protein
MSAATERYVLDANAFIQAKRRFYAFLPHSQECPLAEPVPGF